MRRRILSLALLALVTLSATNASAQVRYGGQLNVADDVDLGIGVRAAFSLGEHVEGMNGIVSFDLFFPGRNSSYWELSGNLHFRMPVDNPGDYRPYLGGGLRLARLGFDSSAPGGDRSETSLGLNLVVGTRFPTARNLTPFMELRIPVGGLEVVDLMLVVGLYF